MTQQHDDADETLIAAYHDGWYSARTATVPYTDAVLAAQWQEGRRDRQRDSKTHPVLPARPEGYYHLPVGTFD